MRLLVGLLAWKWRPGPNRNRLGPPGGANPGGGKAGGHSRFGRPADEPGRGRCRFGHHCPTVAWHPGDPKLLERQADIYATLPFLQSQAAEIYKRLLAQRPNDLALKNKLANIFLALRRIDQAEKLFKEVLAAEPDNAEAHLGAGCIYPKSAFYTLAQYHFDQALARMPDNQEAREGLKEAQGLTTPQLQALAGYFEDSEGFRRSDLYSSYRLYLYPRLRLYGGYGYLSYSSGPALFPKSNLGRALHRHVLPLVLQYRPVRTLFLELGGAFNDYARWGSQGQSGPPPIGRLPLGRVCRWPTVTMMSLIFWAPSGGLGVCILTISPAMAAIAT